MTNLFIPTARNNVWKMYAIRLFFWTHFIASVLIPFFRDWGGLDFTRILLLNAWFMAWNFLLEVPTGTVADFLGRRVSVVLAFVVNVAGIWIYVSHPSFGVFLVAEVFLACAMTLLSGADEALVYDSLKEIHADDEEALAARATRVLPRLESFKLGGIVIGAFFGSFIAARFDLTMPLKSQSVALVPGLLLALTLYEPKVGRNPEATPEPYHKILASGVRYFLGHRILRILTFDMVVLGALGFMIIWLYQPLLERAGVELRYFGLVHMSMSVAQILLLGHAGRVIAVLGSEKRLLALAPWIAGVSFILLGVTQHLVLVVPAILLAASFGLARPALFGAYLNRHIPSEKRATVLSTVSMARTVAIALVNPLVGLLADVSLTTVMIVLGAAMIVLALISGIREEHLVTRAPPGTPPGTG